MGKHINPHASRPVRTKPKYWECYAKVILENCFSYLANLQLEDKPDLQDSRGHVGIEVTKGMDEKHQEADGLYLNYLRSGKMDEERLSQIDATFQNGSLGYAGVDSCCGIIKAFKAKIEKLNAGHYRMFPHNWLFIFEEVDCREDELKNALQEMREIQASFSILFERVLVAVPTVSSSHRSGVQYYDFKLAGEENASVSIKQTTKSQRELALEARSLVEQGENDA